MRDLVVRTKYFRKLDAKDGYWSIVLDDENLCATMSNKKNIVVYYFQKGRYEYLRLSLGLKHL